ncbi:MAG: transporter substrate-binding domain-containing protein [Pseudomonadota bacterium]
MRAIRFVAAFLLGAISGLTASATELHVLAADLPPFSMQAEGAGFNHELTALAVERAGYTLKVKYLPWQRAQKMIMEGEDYLSFNLTRTQVREPHYSWIAPLIDYQNVFVTTSAQIDGFEEAAAFGAVLVRDGTPQLRHLLSAGIDPIRTNGLDMSLRMIERGRPVVWYTNNRRATWAWRHFDLTSSPVFGTPLTGGTLYLAASPSFPKEIARDLALALEDLRADGTYDALMVKYFGVAE